MVGGNGLEPMTSAMSIQTSKSVLTPQKMLDLYLRDMALSGLSPNYTKKVNELLTTYIFNMKAVSVETAKTFLVNYLDHKPNTYARYATYIRGFLSHYGLQLNLKIKVPKTLPPFIELKDIDKLIETIRCKSTHRSFMFRDITLIETSVKTGLRCGELGNLKVSDLDFDKLRLKVVQGKGKKDRVIPLLSEIAKKLQTLCAGKAPDELVFGLAPRGITMRIYEWSKKAGVNLHTHSLRHYFATTLVDKGANIRAVQELMGHENLNTTQIYLGITAKHLESAIQLLS
jgi:integrase